MDRPSAKAPVIIIRKKTSGGGHHGGAWKVAYADFVTAMMALFIVLWLLSSNQEVKKVVGGYFTDPSGSGKMAGSTRAGSSDSISLDKPDLERLKEKLAQSIQELPKLNDLKQQVEMTVTSEGLRIELKESLTGLFFELGSPRPTHNGAEVLQFLGKQLASIPNAIVIEGHTDSKPYVENNEYSNWELSSDRANAARRLLLKGGLAQEKVVQVRGFADQRLRVPSEPENAANRRISIIVKMSRPDAKTLNDNVGS